MKTHDLQVVSSLEISGSLEIPIVNNSESIPSGLKSGSIFFNKEDNLMYLASGSQNYVVGSQTDPPPPTPQADIEYLVVGGGGGSIQGGGGAGGLLSSSLLSIESGSSITVTIGGGGVGDYQNGSDTFGDSGTGSSITSVGGTTFTTITVTGGGGGAKGYYGVAQDGGSGGGGAGLDATGDGDGGAGTVGQGNDGGIGTRGGSGGLYACGGGGGAGEVGADGQYSTIDGSTENGGAGGDGKQSSITGTATYYAGGGGGGVHGDSQNYVEGPGGQGGGGAAAAQPASSGENNGNSGTVNTGGGGGGASSYITAAGLGGSGGSGVVILAYPSSSINAAGGIVGDAGNGKKYHQFNESGTFKVGSTSDFGTVTDSLVAHYDAGNFSSRGTSTWTDLQGTNNGSVTNATLGQNFSYSFDGSGDYIDLGSIDTFSDGEYTMEAWCKIPAFSSPALMSIFTLQDDIYAYIFIYADGSFRMNTETSSGTGNLYTSTGYDDGNWHHVVATYTPGLLSGYVDGVADGTNTTGTGNPNSNDGWSLVGGYDSSKASLSQSYPLLGDVAQIRVYNKALSAAEILQNYNATKTNFV